MNFTFFSYSFITSRFYETLKNFKAVMSNNFSYSCFILVSIILKRKNSQSQDDENSAFNFDKTRV